MSPFEHAALHHIAQAAAAVSRACDAVTAAVLADTHPAHAAELLKRVLPPLPVPTPPVTQTGE